MSKSKGSIRRPKQCVMAPTTSKSGQGEVMTNLIKNTKVTLPDIPIITSGKSVRRGGTLF